jgi:hypothetical protein
LGVLGRQFTDDIYRRTYDTYSSIIEHPKEELWIWRELISIECVTHLGFHPQAFLLIDRMINAMLLATSTHRSSRLDDKEDEGYEITKLLDGKSSIIPM